MEPSRPRRNGTRFVRCPTGNLGRREQDVKLTITTQSGLEGEHSRSSGKEYGDMRAKVPSLCLLCAAVAALVTGCRYVNAPDAPVIASPPSGMRTKDNAVTLTGTAEAGSIVEIFDGATSLGKTAADADGSWMFTTAPLADGVHDFTATAMDVLGMTSTHSAAVIVITGLFEGEWLEVAAGAFTLAADGGSGTTGSGGRGGDLYVECCGTEGIRVLRSGTVDTTFKKPSDPTVDFGANPLVVSTDLTIGVGADQAAGRALAADLGCYMYRGNYKVWLRDDTNGDSVVTGLDVEVTATLTLGLNYDAGGNNGLDAARINFRNDIRIAGALTTKDLTTGDLGGMLTLDNRHGAPATAADKGGLDINSCRRFLLTSTGRIDTSGDDGAPASGERGGDGGYIWLHPNAAFMHGSIDVRGGDGDGSGIGGDGARAGNGSDYGIYVYSDSVLVNTGHTPDASGGNGVSGGDAGHIELNADGFCFNTGILRANGGSGTTGNGGRGNCIEISSNCASVYNSGNLHANGGASTFGTGGSAGSRLYICSEYRGVCFNSGDIEADGGSSVSAGGGAGGWVQMYACGGDVRNVGSVSVRGGGSTNGPAGCGGNVSFCAYEGHDDFTGECIGAGDIILAGDIDSSGGDGASGGRGGHVDIYGTDCNSDYVTEYGIYILGYASQSFCGGSGANGSGGGGAEYYAHHGWAYGYTPTGPVEVHTDFYASGGAGWGGTGGSGGYYYVNYDEPPDAYDENSVVIHDGDVVLNGGDGTTGGPGGGAVLWSFAGTYVTGDFSADAGASAGADTGGASGGDLWIASGLDVAATGSLSAAGGGATGTGTGGAGGIAYISAGTQVTSRASYDASGGDGESGGAGGSGGYVDLFSQLVPTDHEGAWDVSGGDGGTPGKDGAFMLDGMEQ